MSLVAEDDALADAGLRAFAGALRAFGALRLVPASQLLARTADLGPQGDPVVFWQAEPVAAACLDWLWPRRLVLASALGAPSGQDYTRFQLCQFLCLSRQRHEMLQKAGLNSAYFQWYPADDDGPVAPGPPRAVGGAFDPEWLRALAAGTPLAVPVGSVMSEYIGHASSGWIGDMPPAPDPAQIASITAGAQARAARGRRKWQADQPRLASLVRGDGQRWPASDFGAGFAATIRRCASQAAG